MVKINQKIQLLTLLSAIMTSLAAPSIYAQVGPAERLQQTNQQLQSTIISAMNEAASNANVSISNTNMVFLSAGDRFVVNTGAKQYDTANLTLDDLREGTTLGFVYFSEDVFPSPDRKDVVKSGFYTVRAAIENNSSVRTSLVDANGTIVAYPETVLDRNVGGGAISAGWTASYGPGRFCVDYDFEIVVVEACVYWT